ncbi:hypothetical protein ROS1_59440 [Roseibium sp. ROS1]
MILRILLVAGLLPLGACQTEALKTPASISFNHVDIFNIQDTADEAQEHCQQYGKNAEFIPDDRPDGMAHFRCVK